jgi:hypothetical protein
VVIALLLLLLLLLLLRSLLVFHAATLLPGQWPTLMTLLLP